MTLIYLLKKKKNKILFYPSEAAKFGTSVSKQDFLVTEDDKKRLLAKIDQLWEKDNNSSDNDEDIAETDNEPDLQEGIANSEKCTKRAYPYHVVNSREAKRSKVSCSSLWKETDDDNIPTDDEGPHYKKKHDDEELPLVGELDELPKR